MRRTSAWAVCGIVVAILLAGLTTTVAFAAEGDLAFVEFEDDGAAGVDGLDGALGVAVSPGQQVRLCRRPNRRRPSLFARNPTTGALSFVEFKKDGVGGVDGLDDVRDVTVSPDGGARVRRRPRRQCRGNLLAQSDDRRAHLRRLP